MSWQQFVNEHARPCVYMHMCTWIWGLAGIYGWFAALVCVCVCACVCVCLNVYFGSDHRNGVNIIMSVMCGYCFEWSGWACTFSSFFFLSFFSFLQLIAVDYYSITVSFEQSGRWFIGVHWLVWYLSESVTVICLCLWKEKCIHWVHECFDGSSYYLSLSASLLPPSPLSVYFSPPLSLPLPPSPLTLSPC